MRRVWWVGAVCSLPLATGCSSGTDIGAPDPTGVVEVLVSDAASRVDSTGALTPDTYTYVSLPSGSLPVGSVATVRNRATGEAVDAATVDGGVDPIVLRAETGDTIELTADDGDGGMSRGVREVKKRVPPVVVRSDPGAGATDSPTLVRVRLVFSEPIRVGTLTPSVQLLLRDQPVPGTVEVSSDSLVAEFVPADSLVPGATYTVVATRGIRDRTGDALAQELRYEFTVAPYTGPTIAFASVATGLEFTCARSLDADVYCWGRGESGQLGSLALADHKKPTLVPLPAPALELSVGLRNACVLTEVGQVLCWGSPYRLYGEHPTKVDPIFPEPAPLLGDGPMLHGAAGGGRMCAVDPSHALICLGGQEYQSGAIFPSPESDPWIREPGLVDISVGRNHDCYVISDGAAYCYGQNTYGQLGNGATNPPEDSIPLIPAQVLGGLPFTAVTTGEQFTCGLADSRPYCWGANAQGAIGVGAFGDVDVPTAVAGDLRLSLIDAGEYHVCGLTTDGSAYCWGDNSVGELGDGTRTNRFTPTPVVGGLHFRSLSAGVDQTCGVTLDDVLYCWGANRAGQLGDGSTSSALGPIKAALQQQDRR